MLARLTNVIKNTVSILGSGGFTAGPYIDQFVSNRGLGNNSRECSGKSDFEYYI